MQTQLNFSSKSWLLLAAIILPAAALLWLAPAEQTLGAGIKFVYIHVALIWAGMFGIALSGLLGLAIMLFPTQNLQDWTYTLGWVSLAFFTAGLLTSMIAARVNWGGVFLVEPRYAAMFRVLAVGLIIQIANGWPIPQRIKGLLWTFLAAYLGYATLNTELLLHPRNPIQTSTSSGIQLTFIAMFILCCLAGIWLVVHFKPKKM